MHGREVSVCIKSMNRKSMRLSINTEGEVEIRVPLSCPKPTLLSFLNKHTAWIKSRLDDFETAQIELNKQMRFLGLVYHFKRSEQQHKQPILIDSFCYYPSRWSNDRLLEKIEVWQRGQAKVIYQQLIDHWWPHFSHGALIKRPVLRVKKMRSRWGSLSSRGYINMNLKLIELPKELIELVVVHELCHSHFFDHSINFYNLMAEKLPHYKKLEAQLKAIEKGVFQ